MPGDAPVGMAAMAVAEGIRHALREAGVELLQPVMRLEVTVEDGDVGPIATDIRSGEEGEEGKKKDQRCGNAPAHCHGA